MRTPNIIPHPSFELMKSEIEKSLHKGGDGPYDRGMEARVAKLEAHVEHIQSDVTELKSDVKSVMSILADMACRLVAIETTLLTSMATKGFVVGALAVMLALIAALIGFTDQVQSFFGNKPTV